jgi:hypothetical protein
MGDYILACEEQIKILNASYLNKKIQSAPYENKLNTEKSSKNFPISTYF